MPSSSPIPFEQGKMLQQTEKAFLDIRAAVVIAELSEKIGYSAEEAVLVQHALERLRFSDRQCRTIVHEVFMAAYGRQHGVVRGKMQARRVTKDLAAFWESNGVVLPFYVRRQHMLHSEE